MTKGLRLNKKVNENQIENQIMTEEDLVDDILQNYEILSDDYSKYLKKSIDIETFDLLPLYLEAEKLKKLIRFCHVLQKSSMDITGDSLIKLSVIMYSNILDADDMNVRLMACQVLLHLCTHPIASAYGISTAFILKNICGMIQKCIIDVIHGKTYSKKLQREEGNDMEMENSTNFQSFHSNIFHSLLQDYYIYLPLYSNRNEDYILELFADTLVAAICLSSIKEEYSDTLSIAKGAMAIFALRNEATLSASYRSLLPIMTLAGRDPRLPDSSKLKVVCHTSCLEVVEAIISCTHLIPKRDNESRRQSRRVSLESMEEEEVLESSNISNIHDISLPFICAIGFIQRLMMTSSDKNLPKTQIISSLSCLITALYDEENNLQKIHNLLISKKKMKQKKGKRKNVREEEEEEYVDEDGDVFDDSIHKEKIMKFFPIDSSDNLNEKNQRKLATERLLSFLLKLSKSAKLNHRSLCLDLASNLLSQDWIWERHASISSSSTTHTTTMSIGVEEMIEILITRCSDITATVRCRALSSLLDLFEVIQQMIQKNKNQNSELIERIFQLVMGISHSNESKKSLLDTLRDLCLDEKPLVKVKAIHIFGMMFTIEWPHHNHHQSLSNNPAATAAPTTKLYLHDDDILFLAERCTDLSVAVRKETVTTLTQLLISRKSDSTLQQVWIESVLPLIHDPETTIQAKIIQGVIEIILLGCLDTNTQATWSICNKINQIGHIKYLKSSLTLIKRNLHGNTSTSTSNLSILEKNLKEIFLTIKNACCMYLMNKNNHLEEENQVNNIHDLQDEIDYENTCHGGWVLLEALISQNIQLNTTKNSSRTSTINDEFVLECWFHKQQQKSLESILTLDEMDIRILQVMSKIPMATIKMEIKNSLSHQLIKMICHGQNNTPQGLATALAVIFSFATIHTSTTSSSSSSTSNRPKYDFLWLQIHIGALLNYIYEIFYRYLWCNEEDIEIEMLYSNPQILSYRENTNNSKMMTTMISTNTICLAIFLLGEITMLGFSMEEDEDSTYKILHDRDPSLPLIAISENSQSFRIEISSHLIIMIQTLMGYSKFSHEESNTHSFATTSTRHTNTSALTQNSSDFSNIFNKENSSRIRAQSFLTMGKLCLRSRHRARENLTIFLREIQSTTTSSSTGGGTSSNNSAVRSNTILVLGDMCIRFTNLIDHHIGIMAKCLQDPDLLVRHHTFILLTQLLLQDYIKWKGMLLFRFLAIILDNNNELSSLAKYVLKNTLQMKYSSMKFLINNFTEAIIIYNNCTDHIIYHTISSIGTDGDIIVSMDGINYSGKDGYEKRMKIYEFMLQDITDEEKIQITANISQDIFSYILDFPIKKKYNSNKGLGGGAAGGLGAGGDELLAPMEYALIDSLKILQSPLLKLGNKKSNYDNENDNDNDIHEENEQGTSSGPASTSGGTSSSSNQQLKLSYHHAKNKVLKKLSLQHLLHHILPLIISLKHQLESIQSPVQGYVMEYLMYLMKTNKQEILSQVLQNDPTLKEEIEYDIKIYEKEKLLAKKQQEIFQAEQAVQQLELSTRTGTSTSTSTSKRTAVMSSNIKNNMILHTSSSISPLMMNIGTSTTSREGGRGSCDESTKSHERQRVSLTPMLKKSTNEKKTTTTASSRHSTTTAMFDIQAEQVDDFTLRMMAENSPTTAVHEETEGSKRRWSVSAEGLEMNSDSENNDQFIIKTKKLTPQKKINNNKKQISLTKRSYLKENSTDNSIHETAGVDQPSDTFHSPLKKKKKPSNSNIFTSISFTGLGQLAEIGATPTQDPPASSTSSGMKDVGIKEQKKTKIPRKRISKGDILGAL